jgi:hypothetical protein
MSDIFKTGLKIRMTYPRQNRLAVKESARYPRLDCDNMLELIAV